MLDLTLEYVYKNKKKLDIWFKYISIIDICSLLMMITFMTIIEITTEKTTIQLAISTLVFFALLSVAYFILRTQIMNAEEDILDAKIEYSLETYAVPFVKVKLLEEMGEATDEDIKIMCSNIIKENIINHEDIGSINIDVSIENAENRKDYKIVTINIKIKFNSKFYSDKNIIKHFVWLTSNEKSYINEVEKSKM